MVNPYDAERRIRIVQINSYFINILKKEKLEKNKLCKHDHLFKIPGPGC